MWGGGRFYIEPMLKSRGAGSGGLDELERDSWQLELLVTGFALAGMLSGYGEVTEWIGDTIRQFDKQTPDSIVAVFVISCAGLAYIITIVNFFAHVVIRCLWIGAIGSRSVMGDTVPLRRPLAPVFHDFLRRRAGRFDQYIRRLDDMASLIFAMTFLVIGILLSFFAGFIVLVGVVALFPAATDIPGWLRYLAAGGIVTYLLLALVYMIDFFTLGYLKRFRRFSRFYYPVYRLFGWITLARLYRPLYYNLLNRRGGGWLIAVLVGYCILFIVATTIEIRPNRYVAAEFFSESANSRYVMDTDHYADEEDKQLGDLILPSELVQGPVLKVRIPLISDYIDYVKKTCPTLPVHYRTVVHVGMFTSAQEGYYNGRKVVDSNEVYLNREVLTCLTDPFRLYLDSEPIPLTDVLLSYPKNGLRPEVVKFVPIDTLRPGLHYAHLRRLEVPDTLQGGTNVSTTLSVPFYYYPE